VDDTVNFGVLCEYVVKRSLVRHVDLVKNWSLAANQFDTVERDLGGVIEVIDDDDIVTILEKSK
jgi:hypothetical protein